jgi:hypothetical protein
MLHMVLVSIKGFAEILTQSNNNLFNFKEEKF